MAAAVLVAGLIAMIAGKVTGLLYHPVTELEERGYEIEVAEGAGDGGEAQDTGPVQIAAFMADGDVAKGESLLKKCTTCHTFEQGGANRVGPNLWGILNRPIASHGGFAYSDALNAIEGNWTYQKLSEFLEKPKDFAPGTKMAFIGLKKPEDRADMIAYLRTLGGASIPLPEYTAEPEVTPEAPEQVDFDQEGAIDEAEEETGAAKKAQAEAKKEQSQ